MINILLKYLTNYFTSKENNNSLIKTYDQLEALMKLNSPKLLSFIHKNKAKIHQILYDNDQVLKLPTTLADKGLYNLFYIVLLIKSDVDLINYIYDFDFIQKVNDYKNSKINSKKICLTIFILSLVLIQLIDNYKLTDTYCDEENSTLDKINEQCEKIKNDFKKKLKEMNLNISDIYIDKNSLEEIYIEIVKSLLSNKKLDNYDYCSDILGQIELDKIDLTEKMIHDLIDVFNDEIINEYINEFDIKGVDDLFDEKKLNFYLTIFNYILKEPIYIYNFNFLLKARNEILKIIKSESNIKLSQYLYNDSINNKKIKEKLNIILNKFCDNNYYINNYLNSTYRQLFEILQYYKDFYFYIKKQQIINIENYLDNKLPLSEKETNEYLQDYSQAEKLKKLRDIIYYFFRVKNPDYLFEGKIKVNNEKTQNEMINYIKKVETCVKMFEDNKYEKKMRKDDRIIIYKYYNDEEISEEKKSQIIPDNIKESFMKETESMVPKSSNWDKNESNMSKSMDEFGRNKNNDFFEEKSTDDSEIKKEPNNFISNIETKPVEEIIQTEGGEYILSNGILGNISENNGFYSNTKDIEDIPKSDKENPTAAEEKDDKEIEEIVFIGKKNNEISKVKIDKNKKTIKQKDSIKLNGLTLKSCLNLDNKNQIIFCQEGAYHYQNLFDDLQLMDKKKISNDNCIGGIKLVQNLIVFTSHIDRHRINDTDKISFYNPTTKEIVKEIEGYYINNIKNDFGLGILTPSEDNINDDKILLCACKNNESKNGILLININKIEKYNGEKDEKIIKFIETGKFEPYTFCQLKMINDIQTDYFLVGGYNEEKIKGEVKLYKNILSQDSNELDIKFITTLELKNNNSEFNENGIINYIIQCKVKKNIIICSDKNMHIFSEPDFGFDEELMNNDKNEVNEWAFLENISVSQTI